MMATSQLSPKVFITLLLTLPVKISVMILFPNGNCLPKSCMICKTNQTHFPGRGVAVEC